MENKEIRVVLMSDLHDCHIDWYGVTNKDRLDRFIAQYTDYCRQNNVVHTFMLGDYALDFWGWNEGGCYVNNGTSNTDHFVKNYVSAIPTPVSMIPGNHEQYSDADFVRFTGNHRRSSVTVGDYAFILLDSFGFDLDPKVHSDGTYSPVDVEWVKGEMAKYPGKKFFLCGHHFGVNIDMATGDVQLRYGRQFDHDEESDAFRKLVREDDRIIALFQGHTHYCAAYKLGEEYGCKYILQTGNYSYSGNKEDPGKAFWGWRELILSPEGAVSRYYTPANEAVLEDKPYSHKEGYQDEVVWKF